ncbi:MULTISPECIES: TonB-dependent receptor [unclassified Lacinutrix]
MLRFLSILFVFFCFCNTSLSQNSKAEQTKTFITESNNLHKEYLEKFSIHTNKSVYFSGESIWFKAYIVYDITETPNYETTNLHVNIYDAEKKLVANQLCYVTNGNANGKIKIPEDLKSGTYYIELDTNWNSNFKNTYIKPIQINNLQDDFINKTNSESFINNIIDFQFYPESNVILKNAENTIYFIVTENNLPLELNGNVIDSNGEVVSQFNSDKNGLGSFKLRTNKDAKYYVAYNKEKFEIPKAQETGFIIHKNENNESNDSISLSLITNETTIQQQKGTTFFAVIHRKGYVLSAIPVTLNEDHYSYNLNLSKKDLFNGVNTITLFNKNNQPIAERNFYSNNKKLIKLEATKISQTKDSTYIKINLKNTYTNTNVSISVLPENSLMYKNQYNILTDFLVTPYINDKTGSITEYFSEESNTNKLDTYIQTKSKNNFVNLSNNTKGNLKHEVGIKIKGFVILDNEVAQNSKIMLTSQENNIVLVSKLKPDNTFAFDNLLLKQNSSYKLSLVDNNGKLLKATIKINEEFIDYKPEAVSSKYLNNFYINNYRDEETTHQSSKEITKLEYLDEVVLEAKIQKIILPDDYPDPKVRGNSVTKTYLIDENQYTIGDSALDVVKDLPGVLINSFGRLATSRGPKSIIPGSRNDEVAVIMNGVRVSDLAILLSIDATEIVEAKVNASGAGYGLDGFAGVIILKTKGVGNPFKNKNTNTESHLIKGNVDFGFTITDQNYSNYEMNFPTKNSKIHYSALDWLTNVDLKPNTDNFITVYNNHLDNIKLIINGQNDKGNLVFEIFIFKN